MSPEQDSITPKKDIPELPPEPATTVPAQDEVFGSEDAEDNTRTLDIVKTTPEPAGVEDSLEVDSNGFVPEPPVTPVDENAVTSVENTVPFQAQLAPFPVRKKSKKKLLLIIAAAAAVVLGGGYSVFALWYNTPDKVVTDALGKVLVASSATSRGTMTIDSADKADADMKIAYDFALSKTALSSSVNFDTTTDGKTTTLKSNVVVAEQKLAIKITNIRDIITSLVGSIGSTYLEPFDGLINKIDNKWVVLTKDDLDQYSGNSEASKEATCAQVVLVKFRTDKGQQREVVKVYEANRFITVSKNLGTEMIDGKLSNHYELTVDEKKAETFGNKLTETAVFKAADACYKDDLAAESKDSVTKDQDTESKSTSKTELWVDTLSHAPTKFKVSGTEESGTTSTFESTIQLGTNPTIIAPKADTTLKDLQSEIDKLQQSMYGTTDDSFDPTVLGIRTFL